MTTPQPVNPKPLEDKYRHKSKSFSIEIVNPIKIFWRDKLVYKLHKDDKAGTMRLEKVDK